MGPWHLLRSTIVGSSLGLRLAGFLQPPHPGRTANISFASSKPVTRMNGMSRGMSAGDSSGDHSDAKDEIFEQSTSATRGGNESRTTMKNMSGRKMSKTL